ncbi:tyrosine-type recombinase/integrase [Bacillus salipaludis]|uniref:Tyrosine-type recombinase/integrase n=1 Tax=Bacillus salipaludis TaxID=2547811 RepID=A0ABW8RLJ1_9BACI
MLKFAFQDFLDDRKFKNTTKVNLRNYQTLLGEFINYCTEHVVVYVEDINYSHIKQYLLECQEKGNKAGTINTKLMRIRAFLNYMVECEIIKTNPAHKVKMKKDDVKIDVFTDEQIKQMLNFYRHIRRREKQYFAYRDYMMIVLILGTGIRRGEIINLKWSDVDLLNHNISVFGKTRRKETIPTTVKLSKELGAYKTFCKQYYQAAQSGSRQKDILFKDDQWKIDIFSSKTQGYEYHLYILSIAMLIESCCQRMLW